MVIIHITACIRDEAAVIWNHIIPFHGHISTDHYFMLITMLSNR